MRAAPIDRSCEQRPGSGGITAVTSVDTSVQQRLGLPDPLGNRRQRPVDVGHGQHVAAIQKQHAAQDVYGAPEPSPQIVIETREKQLFDPDRVIGAPDVIRRGLATLRGIGHRRGGASSPW